MISFDCGLLSARLLAFAATAALAAVAAPAALAAQTDYYNTDAGRPVQIEDAYATERYAFELQLAPLRLERGSGGVYSWGIEPHLAYGILPRTHVEVGFPVVWSDATGENGTANLGGIEISALHNLNVETAGLPAFGIAAEATLPVGSLAPDRIYPTLKGIATRTFGFARFHVNAAYTFGPEPPLEVTVNPCPEFSGVSRCTARDPLPVPGASASSESRWMAGFAVDKVFPLNATLLIADLYASQPISEDEDLEWNTGAGIRYQRSPRLALDAGIGRRLTGDPGWFVTLGSAYAFAIRSLMPGG